MEIKNLKKDELLKLKDDIDTQLLNYIENINNFEIYINPNDNEESKHKSKKQTQEDLINKIFNFLEYEKSMFMLNNKMIFMKIEEAITILENHNKWRRGSDELPMAEPYILGIAIDLILLEIKKVVNK